MNSSVRFALYFSAFYVTSGLMLAFWPVWLKDRGLDAAAIGTLLFAAQWIKVVGTLASGNLADRFGAAKRVVIALSLAGVCVMALFGQVQTYWLLLALTLCWGASWPGILPVVDGQAMQAAMRDGFDYGRVRLWGSVTFIAATVGGGYLLQAGGSSAIYGAILAATAVTAAAAVLLPSATGQTLRHSSGGGVMLQLLRDRRFCLFMIAAGAAQVSHAVFYGFGTLDWRAKGLDDSAIGMLWAMGVVAEIILFALGRRLAERIGIVRLLAIAGVAALLRWAATPFTAEFLPLLALQSLHALTFGATHLATMMFIQRYVPSHAISSAQALYAALPIGLGMGLAMMGAGLLYARFAGSAYLSMVGLGVLSLLATALLARYWRAETASL